MKPTHVAEAVNTLHWIPTGVFYVCKKTGEKKEKKRKVVHRRLFLTAVPDAKLISLARNLRIVQTRRNGEVTYSLSERKETARPWWEKAPPTVAKDYTRVKNSSNGKVEPPMTAAECIRWLTGLVPNPERAFDELVNGEPLEGDERWDALEKYGYERPEYEDEEVAAAA